MILSLWTIDFLHAAGTLRLLAAGEHIAEELAPEITGPAAAWSELATPWGGSTAAAGATTALSWSVLRDHASHAASRGWCLAHASAFPAALTGTLRLSIQDGETWDLADATLTRATPQALGSSSGWRTLTAYTATGGRLLPAAPIPLHPGILWEFILQDWDALTGDWDALSLSNNQ